MDIPESPDENCLVHIGLLDHADTAGGVVEPLQLRRKLREEGGSVMCVED